MCLCIPREYKSRSLWGSYMYLDHLCDDIPHVLMGEGRHFTVFKKHEHFSGAKKIIKGLEKHSVPSNPVNIQYVNLNPNNNFISDHICFPGFSLSASFFPLRNGGRGG